MKAVSYDGRYVQTSMNHSSIYSFNSLDLALKPFTYHLFPPVD